MMGQWTDPSATAPSVSASTSLIIVFPQGGNPTVISPCRTIPVSQSCPTLLQKAYASAAMVPVSR